MILISGLFKFYRLFLSPAIQAAFDVRCRFEESCSAYTERAIREEGLMRGSIKGFKRIISCNPFTG